MHMLKACSSRRSMTKSASCSRATCSTLWPRESDAGTPYSDPSTPAASVMFPRGLRPRTPSASGSLAVARPPCARSARSCVLPDDDRRLAGGLAVHLADVDARASSCLLAPAGQLTALDEAIQRQDGVHQRLGPRRAPWRVHVDRNDLIEALDDGVVLE